jgi:HEAT repeat protein
VKNPLRLLEADSSPEARRTTAEEVNQNPEQFLALLDSVFDNDNEKSEAKNRILDLVDLYATKLALSVVERAIEDTDSRIKVRGLQAAYRLRVDSLNSAIEELLLDEKQDFEVRKWALHILGKTDSRLYGRTIRRTARDVGEHPDLRKEAIFALTETPDDENLGLLCALLGDSDAEIRQSVAWALSDISSADTINCLLAALEDDDETVRDWAIRGLRDMDDARALEKLSDALVGSSSEDQVRMIRLVVEKRSDVIQRAIVVLLDSASSEVRRVAAWAMGVSPYPPAVPSLKALLEDPDEEVRNYARVALIRNGGLDPSDLRL